MKKFNKIHSIEHNLFIEWMEWLRVLHPEHGFMYDGIICKEEWDNTENHILFILKDYNEKGTRKPLNVININDANDIKNNIFNLRYHLQHSVNNPEKWRTWNNIARWTYGLLKSSLDYFPPFSSVNNQGDTKHRSSNLKKVAIIDVKKKPGKKSCNKKELSQYFKDYPESYSFLAKQIALYGKLDFVICCGDGLYDIFKEIVNHELIKEQFTPIVSNNDYMITQNRTIVINFIHPLLLQKKYNKEKAYNRLMEIVQKALNKLYVNPNVEKIE